MTQPKSVIDVLVDQHEHIRKLLDEVADSSGGQRGNAFAELRRMLAVHEAAEEMVTHPEAQRSGGISVVAARLDEEREAKLMLAGLDRLDPDSAEFSDRFQVFKVAVLEHADAEERFEFPLISDALEPADLEEMGDLVKTLERAGPSPAEG